MEKELVPKALLSAESLDTFSVGMSKEQGTQLAEKLACLDEYEPYSRLVQRKNSVEKYGYLFALGPFLLVLAVGVRYERSIVFTFFAALSVLWAGAVTAYALGTLIYWASFRCPRCRRRFGTDDDECWGCGLPRHCS